LANEHSDLDAFRIAVHSLKGSGRGIGAEKLGDMAEKLEFAARENNLEFITANTGAFIEASEKLLSAISEFIRKVSSEYTVIKPEIDAPDSAVIAEIKIAAENYDMAALKTAIETLNDFSYREQPDLVQSLREKAGKSDFEGILKQLA
jgi:HPt (histidine-containing phosphotransfer) domain-containing protein